MRSLMVLPVRGRPGGRLAVALVILAAMLIGALVQTASACSTPVYRYAMYNWASSPFFVFYFHDGTPAEEDKTVNDRIEALTADWPAQANIRLELVDTADSDLLERLPKSVIEAWKSENDGGLPAHMVFTPWGARLFAGRLDENAMDRLIDSPVRQKLGRLLAEGNAAVMVFIPGKDEEQNQRVEKVLGELHAMGAAGKIPTAGEFDDPAFAGVMPPKEKEEADGGDRPEFARLRIATLRLDRDDADEQWLAKTLMAIEPDLYEYEDQPMVFAAYGRGRAMEPYIGKGITTDNLVDCVMFLAGACSCMVKGQNPGADLLFKWDWEATADAMAANDPTLDADPWVYQGSPVSETSAQDQPEEVVGADDSTDHADDNQTGQPRATDLAQTTDIQVTGEAAIEPDAEPGSLASRQMLLFGVGFVVIAAIVAFAGLLMMGRR